MFSLAGYHSTIPCRLQHVHQRKGGTPYAAKTLSSQDQLLLTEFRAPPEGGDRRDNQVGGKPSLCPGLQCKQDRL